MKQFDSLNNTFNMDDTMESLDIMSDSIEKTASNQQKLVDRIVANPQKYTLENIEYYRTELQSLVAKTNAVLDELAQSCKVGAPPRFYEVFSTLSNTVNAHLMACAKLDEIMTDYKVTETKEELAKQNLEAKERLTQAKLASQRALPNNSEGGQTLIQNNFFTSKDLLKMAIEANKTAQINTAEIKPEFNLD